MPKGVYLISFAVVDWLDIYSCARDDSGEKELLDDVILVS